MNKEAVELAQAASAAAKTPSARMAGVSGALLMLVSWVLSVERRLEDLKNGGA